MSSELDANRTSRAGSLSIDDDTRARTRMSALPSVLGVDVDDRRGEEVIDVLAARLAAGRPTRLAYVNAHTVNLAYKSKTLATALGQFDLILNDGLGLKLAGIMLRRPFKENLNGSDFTLRIMQLCAIGGHSVFLMGGRPGVADAAATKLRERFPRLQVVGTMHGYGSDAGGDAARVRDAQPKVLLVALGNPQQELWLHEHFEASGATLGVGVGAFLDFQSGRVPRAPKHLNTMGFEWLYRLRHEPERLWRRYLLGNPLFLGRVLIQALLRLPRRDRTRR